LVSRALLKADCDHRTRLDGVRVHHLLFVSDETREKTAIGSECFAFHSPADINPTAATMNYA
jgi:hypothetical protein